MRSLIAMFAAAASLAAAAVCASCQRQLPSERVLLRVNGQSVTVGEFEAAFARMSPSLGDPPEGSRRRTEEQIAFLERLIEEMLVEQEAQRLGVGVSEAELDAEFESLTAGYGSQELEKMLADRYLDRAGWRKQVHRRLLARRTIDRALAEGPQIGQEEARAYYESHATEFARSKEVHARQILVESESLARELRTKLRRGADFAEVAREHSSSPDAKNGGDLGFFSAGHMPPEFDRVVFRLPPGRVSDVVISPYGYHLFWVEEVREPRTVPLEEAMGEIVERLRRQHMEEAYRKWIAGLRSKARIEIHQELLGG